MGLGDERHRTGTAGNPAEMRGKSTDSLRLFFRFSAIASSEKRGDF